MDKIFKAVIVGGGASGLMCAVELLSGDNAISGEDIAIIEANDRVGKKLLATGNGQGNLTNAKMGKEFYHGDENFITEFLSQEKDVDLEKYFNSLGIFLTTDEDGKKYPVSKQASSVLDVLRAYITMKGASVFTSQKVNKIEKKGEMFTVFCGENKYGTKSVVLSCGGKAGKQYGTDGSSYSLAEDFGHTLTKTYPSLVQVKTETQNIKSLKGIKERANVCAYDGEKLLKSAKGDVLFTDFGVSGDTVFKVSGYLACAKEPKIKIEFLPDYSVKEVEDFIFSRKNMPQFSELGILCGIVNKRVGEQIVKRARSNSPKDIAYAVKNFSLNVRGSLDFNYAQVTKGGIKTREINAQNYQSKLCKDLYIVGEMLDVDGDCGGYNLTFAFVSAIISARNIKNRA